MRRHIKWDYIIPWKGESKMQEKKEPIENSDEAKELQLIRLYDIVVEIENVEISEIETEDNQKHVVIILKDTIYDKEIGFKKFP